VLGNRVLRGIFSPKRDEIIGGWRNVHNEEFHDLYPLPNITKIIKSRRIRWAGHVAQMEEKINGGKARRTETIRRRWEDNIKMDVREIGWGDMDWIHLPQDSDQCRSVVTTAMNLRMP
jgi:hypothetical protein